MHRGQRDMASLPRPAYMSRMPQKAFPPMARTGIIPTEFPWQHELGRLFYQEIARAITQNGNHGSSPEARGSTASGESPCLGHVTATRRITYCVSSQRPSRYPLLR
jgi:hypothetical protein